MYRPDSIFEFSLNHFIKFGAGACAELGYEVRKFGGSKALIVTDKGVVGAGILQNILQPLEQEGITYAVFDGVIPEPTDHTFAECLSFARQGNYDIIIGVGGGSAIDVAKTVGILLKFGGELLDYVAPPTGQGKPISGMGIPVIACPTTAGTGAEVSPAAVISFKELKLKAGISSPYPRPVLAQQSPVLPFRPALAAAREVLAGRAGGRLVHESEQRTANHLLRRVAQQGGEARVDQRGAGLGVDRPDALLGQLH